MMASYSASMNRAMFSFTWRGWSEVRARTRSAGSWDLSPASAPSTARPKSAICSRDRIWTARVTAGLRCQVPAASFQW